MNRLLVFSILAAAACGEGSEVTMSGEPDLGVPEWSHEAIWYQVFVERFRNGDPTNDPTLHDMSGSWPPVQPDGWEPTPWGHDWYAQEPWARATGEGFYYTAQLRRYGGDLQGVMDRLDYLQDLGGTALYLNPLNDAPSLHKFDARSYRHIDRNFGPDPRGDEARAAAEDPTDPSTWVFTAADSLFLELIREVHRRGMRLIVDYSWNHTGITFWAWRDVLANQAESRYAEWYEISSFDDPTTPDTSEFAYRGWAGVPYLPELRKVGRPEGASHGPIEGTLHPAVREHVFNVTRRWLDPDGNGDPNDGIDGFRLDVAEMVPLGFWREYRRFVRSINPEAYLVGEVWWEQWPERMYDPAPWLRGDAFDAVMNYRWYMPTRSWFADTPPHYTATEYVAALADAAAGIPEDHVKAQMNLTASHDTPRFSTSVYNPGRYKYQASPSADRDYRIERPDEGTRRVQEMILVQQFTYTGAPHVWNGDEVGMWGADDPDPRKPMIWGDLEYEDEVADPFGRQRRRDPVAPDLELRQVYRDLIALRKAHVRLFVDGSMRYLVTDDERGVLAYERALDEARAVVAFNKSDQSVVVELELEPGSYRAAHGAEADLEVSDGPVAVELLPGSAAVWVRR
jgi:glycosidase